MGEPFDGRTRPWYRAAQSAGRPTWSSPYIWFGRNELVVDAVQPFFDKGGELAGVFDTGFRIKVLDDYLASAQSETMTAFIMDREGLLVATSHHPEGAGSSATPQQKLARESDSPIIRFVAEYLAHQGTADGEAGLEKEHRVSMGQSQLHINSLPIARNPAWRLIIVNH